MSYSANKSGSQRRTCLTTAPLLVAALAGAWPAKADETPGRLPSTPCEESVPALYSRVSPAVVSIAAMSANSHDVENRFDRVVGSGVVVDASGLILTNSHVVFDRQAINVTLDDGTTLPADIPERRSLAPMARQNARTRRFGVLRGVPAAF